MTKPSLKGIPRPAKRNPRVYTVLTPGLLAAVQKYATDNGLYVSGAIHKLVEQMLGQLGYLPSSSSQPQDHGNHDQ